MRKTLVAILFCLVTLSLAWATEAPNPNFPWIFSPVVPKKSEEKKPSPSSIALYGAVDEKSARKVIAAIHAANKEKTNTPIKLFIDSPGGSVLWGNKIVDAMQGSRRPVNTYVVGWAASMGAEIYTYGDKKFMQPHATLMFHNMSAGTDGEVPQMKSDVGWFEQMGDVYEQHLAKLTGLPIAEIKVRESNRWWILADEAVKNHLVDTVQAEADYPDEAESQ